MTQEEILAIQKMREAGMTDKEIAFFVVKNKDSNLVEKIITYLDKVEA